MRSGRKDSSAVVSDSSSASGDRLRRRSPARPCGRRARWTCRIPRRSAAGPAHPGRRGASSAGASVILFLRKISGALMPRRRRRSQMPSLTKSGWSRLPQHEERRNRADSRQPIGMTRRKNRKRDLGLRAAIAGHGQLALGVLGAQPFAEVELVDDLLHVGLGMLAQRGPIRCSGGSSARARAPGSVRAPAPRPSCACPAGSRRAWAWRW